MRLVLGGVAQGKRNYVKTAIYQRTTFFRAKTQNLSSYAVQKQ